MSDNKWHTIIVHRRKKRGFIQVDEEEPVKGMAETPATMLNTNGRLFIGGAPILPSNLPDEYHKGFTGCLESVKIDKKTLDLVNNQNKLEFCHDNEV